MAQDSLARLQSAMDAVFSGSTGPLSAEELASRVAASLRVSTVPAQVVTFILEQQPGRYKREPDATWTSIETVRSAPADTTPNVQFVQSLTPSEAFEHIKEAVVSYLETAYKIAHPDVVSERAAMLRARGTVAQAPFIESTPAFPSTHKLAELERMYADFLPEGLAELVQHGVPVDRFALYDHQEQALLAAFGEQPNLLVATGTGSGKTEAFLLPILADILREATTWPAVLGPPRRGDYDGVREQWRHSRRHEARPAALRAIVLYPMNALVNDQLSRLRRILARGASPDWQRENLQGNVLHFAMYTSLSKPTGSWRERGRRQRFADYLAKLDGDWQKLGEELRETGNWPRPDSPEMLCRWDVQAAPPDILVTNYSMLEYMLVRPIESQIFESTASWLADTDGARLTLVLDEAHTYTGAKGTEVAHLVRRLKERLGIRPGSSKFRAIATSASIPNVPGSEDRLRQFTADLFGEPTERFSLIQLPSRQDSLPVRSTDARTLAAFETFHELFDARDPFPAADQLARDLDLGLVDHTSDAQVALYRLLEDNSDVAWVRDRTARNATLLDRLAEETWPGLSTPERRERATAGVLAAGSYARPQTSADTPPLLSTRVHAFFRGIGGLWACMDPDCPEVPSDLKNEVTPRPLGKLYTDPRPWCSTRCGARVLELFSCRRCGLLFLGGIPDAVHESLWPWSDDLTGERQDLAQFRIFGIEQASIDAQPAYRSTRTTLAVHPNEAYARPVFEVERADDHGKVLSPFPTQCPRCQNYRAPGTFGDGREIIEPLRTRGPRSFSVVVEDGFRVQPRAVRGERPNYGRKALLFTDSRQEAATLAADLRTDHANDLFRQLALKVLHNCPVCDGLGSSEQTGAFTVGKAVESRRVSCPNCHGTGQRASVTPVGFGELRRRVIDLQLRTGINPTNDEVPNFFEALANGSASSYADAEIAFDIGLRRELSDDEFALDPLGLASWRVALPTDVGSFDELDAGETLTLIRTTARILATENVLLPPNPRRPWEWPESLIPEYDRCVLIWGNARQGLAIPYNLSPRRKLGRYVVAVARALVRDGRLPDNAAAERWVRDLRQPLWETLKGLGVVEWAGAKIGDQVPYGIRIDRWELAPIESTLLRCSACAYLMSDTLLGVCMRCGQQAQRVDARSVRNFYRRGAEYALQDSGFEDPYPLRAIEHTAQIPGVEARDLERWFQDFFRDNEHPYDHRIDVLSVTTTMEMGIDIGSLLCVGLRNVPPTVANYQQRAGRAGRRGSAIATVLTFAQARSHDQYYFDRPPEIVSEPPRVPALYLSNEVIARRHVRSLVLQHFFYQYLRGRQPVGLFSSWGTVGQFVARQTRVALERHLESHKLRLEARCRDVVDPGFATSVSAWISELVHEVQAVVDGRDADDDLFEALINAGLLPKYAFPVDVVSLSIPSMRTANDANGEESEAMQRDLKIALAEYAPGAEVIRGTFPQTYIFRSVGLYNAFETQPNYRASGVLEECRGCQSVRLRGTGEASTDRCVECDSFDLIALPYLRPLGFTVDAALPNAGAELYKGGGRERSGYVAPARLMVGQNSFTAGAPQTPFAPSLFAHVRSGELFSCNKGPNREFPGYLLCPHCGRALDPDSPGSHRYPADVPPHRGPNRGPRAGFVCPNKTDFKNQVILGYSFHSEVLLLGVDLSPELDAPFVAPSGKAVWYSFGTLLAQAAARVLQIDPGELEVGVRPVRRSSDRLYGEVFLYDDVPGGAGYAHAIYQHLEAVFRKALDLGRQCSNQDCTGACYHCLYDYGNQLFHPLLDRALGTAVLDYVLSGMRPQLDGERVARALEALEAFVRDKWSIQPGVTVGGRDFNLVLEDRVGQRIALWVIHPLQARPSAAERHAILAEYGLRCAVHTLFDLERRPFWVANNLLA